jgi:hypothetical protein
MRSMLRGDPDAGDVIRKTFKQQFLGWLPGRG